MVICLAPAAITRRGRPIPVQYLCNNQCDHRPDRHPMTPSVQKLLVWILLSALAVMVTYAAFRGYLGAEFLIGFANTFSC